MKITIYGRGECSTCTQLKETAEDIVNRNNFDAEVTKESDMQKLAKRGIMSTPGFEIGDEVVFAGSIPSDDKLETIIAERV